MMQTATTDIAIIGAGPVGLFAVFQCGMLGMRAHVFDALDSIGGQCTALYPEKPIYDIPAWPQITGAGLVEQLEAQAAPFAPQYHLGATVTMVQRAGKHGWLVENAKGVRVQAKAIIIAAGAGAFGPNRPPLAGIEAFETSKAVQYYVKKMDDFKGKRLVIAGGGDSAVDWALNLAPIAASVALVHRRPKFRAAADSLAKLDALVAQGMVEMVTPYQLHALQGNKGHLNAVDVATLDGEVRSLPADVLLPFFGLSMDLGAIANWGLHLERSHITVNPLTLETSEAGIFAIGDVATYPHKLKLILCGFSEAALAAHAVRKIVYPDEELHFQYSTSKGVPIAAA